MSHTVFFALIVFFPKRKVFFEVAFHENVSVRFFIFSGFLFPFIMSIMALNELVIIATFFFFCGMTVFFLGISISNALVNHIQSSSLLSQFQGKVSKIGWNLDVLSAANTCRRVFMLEIEIPKLLTYLWIPEGR